MTVSHTRPVSHTAPFSHTAPVAHTTLTSLIDEADLAYQEARWKVWDQLAPGEPVDVSNLTESQIYSLRNLAQAEAAVATYREFIYVTTPLRYDEVSAL
jgi:hypothetical protein